MSEPRYFAAASRGTEEQLAAELRGLALTPITPTRGGVSFGTDLEDAYRACMWSRTASRVLLPLATVEATDADQLYAAVHAIAWTDHFGPEQTIAIASAGANSPVGPTHFVVLKSKDAIVDHIRAKAGARPNIDKANPDVRIHLHIAGPSITVSIDLAGRGLHERGLGRRGLMAPLKENLAAALLHHAGWPAVANDVPLVDPMCGSGTIVIEAAAIALAVAPGLARSHFGASGWRGHDRALWRRVEAEARDAGAAARGRRVRIVATDAAAEAVAATRELAARAGFGAAIETRVAELRDLAPPAGPAGLVVTNPPYGARLGEAGELGPVYALLGDVLKRRFPGWTAWILGGNPALDKRIGLRPKSRAIVYNGPIECRFMEIPISTDPVTSDAGPGWRRPATSDAGRGLGKRLLANLARARKWAAADATNCFRLYDSDIPQFNLAVDWYDGVVRVEEYYRPRAVAEADAERRLQEALAVIATTLEVDPADIILRVRRRLEPNEQHQSYGATGKTKVVTEAGLEFEVNLGDRLDTGLYLDDRLLRRRLRATSRGRDFLNLFAHTCTATVAAAVGGARATTSVDLSKTHLETGRRNFELNGLSPGAVHRFIRADAGRYLDELAADRRFEIIFVGPPTWSRSKGMTGDFEIQRDHPRLLLACARHLTADGEILFTTNLRDFALATSELPGLRVTEVTASLTPPEFARRPRQQAWTIVRQP